MLYPPTGVLGGLQWRGVGLLPSPREDIPHTAAAQCGSVAPVGGGSHGGANKEILGRRPWASRRGYFLIGGVGGVPWASPMGRLQPSFCALLGSRGADTPCLRAGPICMYGFGWTGGGSYNEHNEIMMCVQQETGSRLLSSPGQRLLVGRLAPPTITPWGPGSP